MKRSYENKKNSINTIIPFQQLNNNFMEKKPQSSFDIKSLGNTQNMKNIGMLAKEEVEPAKENVKLSKKCFDYRYIIGKGGFGKVWKVQHSKTRNQYAMKEMLKSL